MKPLDTYLGSPDAMKLTALAEAVGISKGRLSQLRDKTDWPPMLALAVERETGHAIDAAALSPVIAAARDGRGVSPEGSPSHQRDAA